MSWVVKDWCLSCASEFRMPSNTWARTLSSSMTASIMYNQSLSESMLWCEIELPLVWNRHQGRFSKMEEVWGIPMPYGDVMMQQVLHPACLVQLSVIYLVIDHGVKRLIIHLIWFILILTCGAEMRRRCVLNYHGVGFFVWGQVWHNYAIQCLTPCTSDLVGVTNYRELVYQ
jgi:hypothetical protein